jgi:hypothetical protein
MVTSRGWQVQTYPVTLSFSFKVLHDARGDRSEVFSMMQVGNHRQFEQFAIACTDEPSRLAYDGGTIWQIVPHRQLLTTLVDGRDRRRSLRLRTASVFCVEGSRDDF